MQLQINKPKVNIEFRIEVLFRTESACFLSIVLLCSRSRDTSAQKSRHNGQDVYEDIQRRGVFPQHRFRSLDKYSYR